MPVHGMMTELRRATGLVAVLRAVHERPGIERPVVARETGMTSGFVTETVARLRALDLVTERPAPPTGGRGRPTTTIHPHPRGPLVVAAAVGHETWKLAVAQLGGTELVRADRAHRRDPDQVLDELGAALRSVRGRYRRRIRAVAVSVPGTVTALGLSLTDDRYPATPPSAAVAIESDVVGLDAGYLPGLGERDARIAAVTTPAAVPRIVTGGADATDAEVAA